MLPFEDTLRDQTLDDAIDQVRLDVSSDEHTSQAMVRVRERIAQQASSARPIHRRPSWMQGRTRMALTAAAAAAIILLLPMSFRHEHGPGPGFVWADVMRAFEGVRNVHVVETMTSGGQKQTLRQAWLRRPDCYRLETPDLTIIDNGTDRLIIKPKARTAAWADSPMRFGSHDPDWLEREAHFVPITQEKDLVITRLDQESTPTLVVYRISSKELLSATGKAWVHRDSLLLERMQCSYASPDKPTETIARTTTYSYEPIPDDVFAPKVPRDFKERPRPPRRTLSGTVVDAQGKGVAQATVHVVGQHSYGFVGGAQTDSHGAFTIALPPEQAPTGYVHLPAFVRAFRPDDPTKVAWTVLRRPYDKTESAGEIPGKPGKLEYDPGGNLQSIASGSDMVLTLEPATEIAGTVTDSAGKAIADAKVSVAVDLFDRNGNPLFYTQELGGPGEEGKLATQTDENGHYRLTHLPMFCKDSWLYVTASAPGHKASHRKLVIGEAWSKSAVDMHLYAAEWTITGRLVDERGAPMAERSIVTQVAGEDVARVGAATDRDGRFRLEKCPAAAKLQVVAELSREYFDSTGKTQPPEPWYYLDVVQDIQPVAGQTLYDVKLVAERPNLELVVQVRNDQGEPLPHFPVSVRGAGITTGWKMAKFQSYADANGRVTIKGVPRAENLELRLDVYIGLQDNKLPPAVLQLLETYKQRYSAIVDLPIELEPGKTSYAIEATALSHEEWKRRRK